MSNTYDDLFKARLEDLTELGLSTTQSRIFVVLLSLGPSGARTVSRVAGLGREDTYRALRFLKSLGLVEVIINRPSAYAAVEPSVAMDILVSQLENKFALLKQKAVKIGEWLEAMDRVQNFNETPRDKIVFKLEGGSQIFESMTKLIQSCKTELVRVTSDTGICQNYVLGIFEREKQITKNGAKIRAVTEVKSSNKEVVEEYASFAHLRHLDGVGSSLKFVIADDSQMIFFTTNPTQNVRDLGAIWTNDKPLIEGFKKEFEVCWSASVPATDVLAKLSAQSESSTVPHLSKI